MSKVNDWMKIDNNSIWYLPTDRPLSVLEALISYTANKNSGKPISVRKLARRWKWTRSTAQKFIDGLESESGTTTQPKHDQNAAKARPDDAPPLHIIYKDLASASEPPSEPERDQGAAKPQPTRGHVSKDRKKERENTFMSDAEFDEWWKSFVLKNWRKGRTAGKQKCRQKVQRMDDEKLRQVEEAMLAYLSRGKDRSDNLIMQVETFFGPKLEDMIEMREITDPESRGQSPNGKYNQPEPVRNATEVWRD